MRLFSGKHSSTPLTPTAAAAAAASVDASMAGAPAVVALPFELEASGGQRWGVRASAAALTPCCYSQPTQALPRYTHPPMQLQERASSMAVGPATATAATGASGASGAGSAAGEGAAEEPESSAQQGEHLNRELRWGCECVCMMGGSM